MPGPCEPDDSTISFAATYSALRQPAEHQKQEIAFQCEYQTEQRGRPDKPVMRYTRKQPQQQCRCEQLDQLTREKGKGTGLTGPNADSQAQCEQRIGYEIRSCPRQRRPTCRRPSDNPRYYCCCEPHGALRRQCQQEPTASLCIQRRAIRVTEYQNFHHIRIDRILIQAGPQTGFLPLPLLHGALLHQTSPLNLALRESTRFFRRMFLIPQASNPQSIAWFFAP
ncbi:hypothetical protein LMG26690_04497 [Achromobacter animicus]|uniref:Uncharacterized protein n=1 Tax=Achromobacter animicus TaxID=1389935 RepID=A0A6S7AHP5_9BURK|nr:hypothetical protein LMG26690_04497 [Achromobacter animicus]CAB3912990.1 hypothetical protein LMG26691_05106 [Achromobacter animicus]